MNNLLLVLTLSFLAPRVSAQQYVIDPQHVAAVVKNTAVRTVAESTHQQYLSKINTNIENLNTNTASVVLAQTMIFQALASVNSALKDGLEVRNMAVIIADMTGYINQALVLAKSEPYLLIVANDISSEMKTRALALVTHVSGFVLKSGNNVLADYNSRDQLLRKVTQELQILDGLAYGTWKAMFWAKQRGIIATLNPFAAYISNDKVIVSRIIQNARYLRH
jgi:hypothetical protein